MEFFSNSKKYKKYHKLKFKTINRFDHLQFGDFGLRILEHKIISIKNLLMILKRLKKVLKIFSKDIKIRFRVFPHFSITRKPKDIRMGRGKGNVVDRVSYVLKGSILLELVNLKNVCIAKKALKYCILKSGICYEIICLTSYYD